MISATPLATQVLPERFPAIYGRLLIVAIYLVALSQVAIFGKYEFSNFKGVVSGGFVREGVFTPVAAADYVWQEDKRHNILGNYSWGGYLLHRLSPRDKLFVDGRTMYEDRIVVWKQFAEHGIEATVDGKNLFNETVAKYAIDTIILPKYATNGVLRMVSELKEREDWTVAFHDKYNVVFTRNCVAVQ